MKIYCYADDETQKIYCYADDGTRKIYCYVNNVTRKIYCYVNNVTQKIYCYANDNLPWLVYICAIKRSLHGRIFSKYTELFNSENIFKTFFTCNIPKTYFENILKMFSECSQQYFKIKSI